MNNVEKPNIIVLGGLGFIGSHLIDNLIDQDYFVYIIDNMLTSTQRDLEHLRDRQSENNYMFLRGDAADIATFDIPDESIRAVFHLGEYSRVNQSISEPFKVFDNNTRQISNIIKFCKEHECQLIYSGSSTKFHTDDDWSYTPTPYEMSKKQNSELVKYWCDLLSIPYAITYFYNVYGPRERASGPYGTVIAKFFDAYYKNDPFQIVLPGNQQRNFTHVYDIVNGLMILMNSYALGDGYAIGAKESYGIEEIANLIDPDHDIDYLPKRLGDRNSASLNTGLIKHLGWEQNYHLKDYIAETMFNQKGVQI